MSRCGEPHPEHPTVLCDMPETPHDCHTGVDRSTTPPSGLDWPNPDFVAAIKVRTRAQREEHKRDVRDRVAVYNGATPVESPGDRKHRHDLWVADALQVVRHYCQHHDQPFTTQDDLWPLLDGREVEMRTVMSRVVREAVKRRWMKGTGDTGRQRDVYYTRDGVPFQANKWVEFYVSLIPLPEDMREV